MRKNITLGLILTSAMALTAVAVAAPAGQADGMHQGRFSHHHGQQGMNFQKLNLTDAQRASIKQIMQSSFAQNKTQWQALRQQRSAFESMTPDQVGYQAAAASLAQAEAAATQVRVQQKATVRAQVYAVLTSTQKAQMASMKLAKQARQQKWQQFKAQQAASSSATPAGQ